MMKRNTRKTAEKRTSILDCMSMIHEEKSGLLQFPGQMQRLRSPLLRVARFFGTDVRLAALISVMLCEQITGEYTSMKKVMRSLGFSTGDFVATQDIVREFSIKGWVKISSNRMEFMSFCMEFTPMVIEAVVKQKKKLLEMNPPASERQALLMMRALSKQVQFGADANELQEILRGFLERFCKFALVTTMLGEKGLSLAEKLAVLWICSEHLDETPEMDLVAVLDHLGEDKNSTKLIIDRIKCDKSPLFTKKYLDFAIPGFADFTTVKPGERLLKLLPPESLKSTRPVIFSPRMCKVIRPEEIAVQDLYFSEKFNRDAEELSRLISREYFPVVMDKCKKSNLPLSATLLFYGSPGTGKTELVKQLSQRHNRVILMVDISQVKSMWVGESEKNLKRVFMEYRSARRFFDATPILLFNEADALISKRFGINNSVDQMSNAMQNILLQELEDFKGIFIATTNLLHNIDPAFDRRLLFKLRFEPPDEEARLRILQSHFSNLPQSVLNEIGHYPLTGGQILNIRRRHEIDQLLSNDPESTYERLTQYVAEETGFRRSGQGMIGFRRA
jgi:hypothetical protein